MAVIVGRDEPIDPALKRLLRESLREGVLQTARAKMRYVKPGDLKREKRRAWNKTKRKRREYKRRLKQKGQIVI